MLSELKFVGLVLVIIGIDLLLIFSSGCVPSKKEETTPRLPIYEQATELSVLPKQNVPADVGQAIGVTQGDTVAFDGILLDEAKAESAIRLRIDYDELYGVTASNRKYLLSVLAIEEQGLQKSDTEIARLRGDLKEIRDSWWARHKLSVGIGLGLVIGIAGTIATGYAWSAIDDKE